MKIRVLFLAVICLFLCRFAAADTIFLKSGNKVEGKILNTTDKETKISVRGITLTYDAYDIDHIEKPSEQAVSLPPVTGSSTMKAEVPLPKIYRQPVENVPAENTFPNVSQPPADSSLTSKDKDQLILDLIDASGARENMAQMFGQIISQASPQDSDKLRGLFNVDDVIAQLVPIYDRHFTKEEIAGLVAFYRSVLGRKLLLETPRIMQESMETSMEYFQKKMEGVTLSNPDEQAPPSNMPVPGQ